METTTSAPKADTRKPVKVMDKIRREHELDDRRKMYVMHNGIVATSREEMVEALIALKEV